MQELNRGRRGQGGGGRGSGGNQFRGRRAHRGWGRGNGRGAHSRQEESSHGYFHHTMMGDPWQQLREEMGWMEDANAEESFHVDRDIKESEKLIEAKRKLIEECNTILDDANGDVSFGCPRCTRQHPGTPDECKSIDKVCRRCGVVGHFQEVHDVRDAQFREFIVQTIGSQLWNQ